MDIKKEKDKEEKKTSSHVLNKREHYMNNLNVETKASMKSRILVGIVLVLIVVPCVILGDYVFAALILVASVISCLEIIKAPQSIEKRFNLSINIFAFFMMVALIFWIILKNNISAWMLNPENFCFDLSTSFTGPQISLTTFFISVLFLFANVLVDKNFTIHDAFYLVTMLFIVSIGFQSILFLRYAPFTYSKNLGIDVAYTYSTAPAAFKYVQSIGLIFYMLAGTCLNDVGAYFIGVLFGKHKMSPRISPKKTWEGFAGGIVISLVVSLTLGLVFDACGLPLLKGVLDNEHWYNVLILSILMPLFSVLGDLIFSAIKRSYQIKDFGTVLKSHGGILDRLDSILIVSIMLALFIEVMAKGRNIMI